MNILCKIGFHKWESDEIIKIIPFTDNIHIFTKFSVWAYKPSEDTGCISFRHCPRCGKSDKKEQRRWWRTLK